MSHHIASLAWLQRAAQVTLPTTARGRVDATAAVAAPATAPSSAAQALATAVQAAVHPDPVVAPQAPVTETPVARTQVDPVVQQFTQALVFALHRAGRERDEDDGHGRHGGHHHGRGPGADDGGERWHHRDGARAYRDMDTLSQRLNDLAAQIRRADAPATPAPAAPGASPVAPVEVPVPTTPTDAAAATAAATPATPATTEAAAAAAPAARPNPLQRLLDAFNALGGTVLPAATPAPTAAVAADAPSARERLARFLEQLAQALAAPGQRAANDACGCSPRGRLLDVAA